MIEPVPAISHSRNLIADALRRLQQAKDKGLLAARLDNELRHVNRDICNAIDDLDYIIAEISKEIG
jgi:hypothetical protein